MPVQQYNRDTSATASRMEYIDAICSSIKDNSATASRMAYVDACAAV
jgi:hypothetical protein